MVPMFYSLWNGGHGAARNTDRQKNKRCGCNYKNWVLDIDVKRMVRDAKMKDVYNKIRLKLATHFLSMSPYAY